MKYSAFLAGCCAVLAVASPILQDRRVYIKTDVVVEWITVTVTDGDTATVFRRPSPRPRTTTTTIAPVPSSTSVAPAPAPPTSTPVPVVQPAPEPTVEAAPVVESPAPVVESPAPVVESPAPVVEAPKASSTPATSTAQAAVAQPSDYTSAALYHHNVHRFNHSAGALEWSAEHAGFAQTLAETCVFAHDT